MKQLETKNQKLITNVLDFYREIGIDITVYDKFFCKEPFLFKDNKKNRQAKHNKKRIWKAKHKKKKTRHAKNKNKA